MFEPSKENIRDLARSVLTLYSMSSDFAQLEAKILEEQENTDYITRDEINKFVLHSQLSLKGFLMSVGESFQANVNADIFHGIMVSTLPPQPKSVFSSITLHLICVDDFGDLIASASATLNFTLAVKILTAIVDEAHCRQSSRTLYAELA